MKVTLCNNESIWIELNERTTWTTLQITRNGHVQCRSIQRFGKYSIDNFGEDDMILPVDGTIWETFDDHRSAISLSMYHSDLEQQTCYRE